MASVPCSKCPRAPHSMASYQRPICCVRFTGFGDVLAQNEAVQTWPVWESMMRLCKVRHYSASSLAPVAGMCRALTWAAGASLLGRRFRPYSSTIVLSFVLTQSGSFIELVIKRLYSGSSLASPVACTRDSRVAPPRCLTGPARPCAPRGVACCCCRCCRRRPQASRTAGPSHLHRPNLQAAAQTRLRAHRPPGASYHH